MTKKNLTVIGNAKSENMVAWDRLATTDEAFTKAFDKGTYSGTAINKQYCLMKLTEVFGPVGKGWGVREEKLSYKTMPNDDVMAVFRVVGWYLLDGQEINTAPGYGSAFFFRSTKSKTDDDAVKKAFSDALTNAFKYVGLSADVYLGWYDDSKYLDDLRQRESEPSSTSETSTTSYPDDAYNPDRRAALDMMGCKIDPGSDVFRIDESGTVRFLNHDNEISWENISSYMVALIKGMSGVDEIVNFAAVNHPAQESIQLEHDLDPIAIGAYGWAKSRLDTIKDPDLKKIQSSWRKILGTVNPLKNTEPSIYKGITDAFKQAKDALPKPEEDDNG